MLLCHASTYCRKDYSGMPLSSVVWAFLMISMPLKRILFDVFLSLVKTKMLHGLRSGEYEVVVFFRTGIFPSLRNCSMLPQTSFITFQTYTNLKWKSPKYCPFSLEQSNDNCHTPHALPAWYWFQLYSLKASRPWSYLSPLYTRLLISGATEKHVCMSYLYTRAEACQKLVREFPSAGPKIAGLFVPLCSWLNDRKKRKGKQKEMVPENFEYNYIRPR